VCSAALIAAIAASWHAPGPGAPEAGALEDSRVEYRLDYNPAGPSLDIRLSVTGVDPARRDVHLVLSDVGEWVEVDSLYVRSLRCQPPARRDPGVSARWVLELPEGWDGSIDVSYSIPLIERGSVLNGRRGLLPWYVPDAMGGVAYAVAFSENTLMRVLVDGELVRGARVITLGAPEGLTIASGWGGTALGSQSVTLPADLGESPIAFGRSPLVAAASRDGVDYEVVQFSATPDATVPVLALAQALIPSYGRACARPIDRPVRVFITDKGGGQWMDRGVMMQAASEGEAGSPYYRHLVAHELFHQWLGGYAKAPDESTVWFKEGFTDYLSLWHLAATGLVDHQWFVSRLLELNAEARRSEAFGHMAFGDPSATWRDGDGPAETLAYRGGAILAFLADCELRRHGRPGLSRMIGDLGAQGAGPYSLTTIRQWMERHGLAEFYARHVAAPGLPSLDESLEFAGFHRVERTAELSYIGAATQGNAAFGTVSAVDPAGPAAAAGLAIGDQITGFWLTRPDRPQVAETVTTPYRFGLELFPPGAAEVNIGVLRGDQDLTIRVAPRPMPGGLHVSYTVEPLKAAKFFDP
jgi:hypothetical protein